MVAVVLRWTYRPANSSFLFPNLQLILLRSLLTSPEKLYAEQLGNPFKFFRQGFIHFPCLERNVRREERS